MSLFSRAPFFFAHELWIVVACLLLGTAFLNAQDAGLQGAIRGRVLDSEFYQGVPGAEVSLEGSNAKATSAEDGSFFLNALSPGIYNLLITRPGYARERVSDVVVTAGSVTETEVRMTAEVVELDDFVVSVEDIIDNAAALSPTSLAADMASFSAALGGDFLAKISGGGDISGAITRLAGTSVVDSRYVVIRGLSDRYNVVVLNSARIPSSDPDKRAVNIDIFPSTLVQNVVSSKTFTPDMPGEATGGFLNVVTKSIPEKPFVNFFLESAYNTQATANRNYIIDDSGGTGFLGTARDRALPGPLRPTDRLTLPLSPPTITDSASGTSNVPDIVLRNRNLAATLLGSRSLGSDTKPAPMDFAASLSAGTLVEDFFGGRLGILGALSYSKRYELDQGSRGRASISFLDDQPIGDITRILRFTEGEEKLLAGALLSIGWQGPERDTVTFTYFNNIAADSESTFAVGADRVQGNNPPSLGFNPNLSPSPLINETQYYTERKLSTFQLTGEHLFSDDGDIKIDWAAAYSFSSQDEPDVRFANYIYNRETNNFSTLSNDFSGPQFERIWRRLDDQNYNLNLNVEMPIGTGSLEKERAKIKYGGSFEHSNREYQADNFTYRVNAIPTIPYRVPNRAITPTANNRVFPSLGDQIASRDRDPSNPGDPLSIDSTFLARTETPPGVERYTALQDIAAVYAMATFNISRDVELIFGGRLETTDIKIAVDSNFDALDPFAGGFIFNDLITGELIPLDQILNPRIVATDLLPAAALSWEFAEKMSLRASATRTIARPTFKEIAPVLARDPATGNFFVGNVRLKRSDIFNYDMRVEWFPNPTDYVILSVFSKYIQDPIEAINLGSIETVFNEQAAAIYGFEIELSKKLTEWGPFLEDISLGFNYAKMISQVQLSDISRAQREAAGLSSIRALQGQPDYTMNFNAIYDNEEYGITLGAFLNITGELLYQVGGVAGDSFIPDVYQETYTRLDFNISKRLFDDWDLSLRVGNFLNTERRREFRVGNQNIGPLEYVKEGTVYAISLSKKW